MRKIIVISLIIVGLLTGCSNFFQANFFSGLDVAPNPTIEDLSGMEKTEALETLNQASDSEEFLQNLEENETKKEEIVTYLNDTFLSTTPTNEAETKLYQEAAVLTAEIQIKTTGGDEVIQNVLSTVVELQGESNTSTITPQSIIDKVIPKDQNLTRDEKKELLVGFIEAAAAFDKLGSTLTDEDGDGLADNSENVDVTKVVSSAVVSYAVKEVVERIDAPEGQGIDALVDFLEDDSPTKTLTFKAGQDVTSIEDIVSEGSPADNLLEAGGFETLLSQIPGAN